MGMLLCGFSIPTMLIVMDRDLVDPAIPFKQWPNRQELLSCPPSAVADHPWSNRPGEMEMLGDRREAEGEEVKVDKGKGRAVEVSTQDDGPSQQSVEEVVRGRQGGRGRRALSRARSQPRRTSRAKSAAFVNSNDEVVPATRKPRCTVGYDIHNPTSKYQRLVEDQCCIRCVGQGFPCAIKAVGNACYQCAHTKHSCNLVVPKRGHSRSVSHPARAKTPHHHSPSAGPSRLHPATTNPPQSGKHKGRSLSVAPAESKPGKESKSCVHFIMCY